MTKPDLRSAVDFDLVEWHAWEERPEHVGVWLDRCYYGEKADGAKDKPSRRKLYERAVEALRIGSPGVQTYKPLFERWRREVSRPGLGSRGAVVEIEATTRVLLHPASNATVTDGAVLLHHTYGVPYLPGSGLKGLARAWMRRTVDVEDEALVRALFGFVPRPADGGEARGQAAAVDFLDALWIPEAPSGKGDDWSPLALDVVNPHHGSYYTGRGEPADTSEPVPTLRLSIEPGARFLVALEGVPMQDAAGAVSDTGAWIEYLLRGALEPALASMGFGAWTSAGYGRFELKTEAGKGIPSLARAADADTWYRVSVTFDPGSGKLSATIPGAPRRVAGATGQDAMDLRGRLSPELQEKLKRKRELQLQVRIEPLGNAWRIVDLRPR